MRNRTNYYSSLFRLLSFEIEDNPSIFEIFMQPLTGNYKFHMLFIFFFRKFQKTL